MQNDDGARVCPTQSDGGEALYTSIVQDALANPHHTAQAAIMLLRTTLSNTWHQIQTFLFPQLREEIGILTPAHQRLIVVLETVRVEAFVPLLPGRPGRPPADRQAIARAFIAKAVLGLPQTNMLVERLLTDKALRRLCGWEWSRQVPSEATFSRAFAAFAASALPARVHEALIAATHSERLVGHISRDATAIEAREAPVKRAPAGPVPVKRKRGRPRKGEVVSPRPPTRLERQAGMTLAEMLADLPTHCAIGTKRNAKGHQTSWIGYKPHIDVADGDIPVSCLLTSASLHDSQAAIPLALITAQRVTSLYDLMDSAYDAQEIHARSMALGHVPIIEPNPRRGGKAARNQEERARRHANSRLAEERRYDERSAAERVNSGLKDSYGGRFVRVRGHAKVYCHLMFGILALTVEQLMRLVI